MALTFAQPAAGPRWRSRQSPRMVTCELSRVCWLKRSQHNMQHMQITRRREKSLSRAETALGAFRKRSVRRMCRGPFAWERGQHQTEITCSTCTQYIYHEVEKGGPSPPPPPVRSSEVRHSPPEGLLSPIRGTPHRSTLLITAVPGSRPRAGAIPSTAVGFCASACARLGLAGEHRDPPPPKHSEAQADPQMPRLRPYPQRPTSTFANRRAAASGFGRAEGGSRAVAARPL